MNVKELLSEIQKTKPLAKADIELIEKAYNFSQLAHKGQRRKSGEPYFNHSYEAALKIAGWRLDSKTIAAAHPHDIAEDTKSTIEDIKKKQTLKTKKEECGAMRAENLRKMILALSQDIRVVLIKLADRLHNMKTLSALPPQKQKRIALETS